MPRYYNNNKKATLLGREERKYSHIMDSEKNTIYVQATANEFGNYFICDSENIL